MRESETSAALSPDQKTALYAPGTLVRVTQQIPHREDTCAVAVSGRVVRHERHNSGSWFAGNKDDRVWLDRLVIRKEDGEISVLNLDEYSAVEVLVAPSATPLPHAPPSSAGEVPLVEPAQESVAGIT